MVWEGELECFDVSFDKGSICANSDIGHRHIKLRWIIYKLFSWVLQWEQWYKGGGKGFCGILVRAGLIKFIRKDIYSSILIIMKQTSVILNAVKKNLSSFQYSNYLPQGFTNAPIIDVPYSKLKFDINLYLFFRTMKKSFRDWFAMLTPPIQNENSPWSINSSYFPLPISTIFLSWKGPTPKYYKNLMTL